jgi:homoserine kinase type II
MLARMHAAGATSRCSSRTCAAWPGGRPRCPWCCRTWRRSRHAAARRTGLPAATGPSAAGQALPRGHIHADLFRDNVMFDDTAGEDRLCGFFDFYFAGTTRCCSTWRCA